MYARSKRSLILFALVIMIFIFSIPLGVVAAHPAASDVRAAPTAVVRVRTGPGITYPIIGLVSPGSSYNVVGRDSASQWLYLEYRPAQFGWSSAGWFTLSPSVASLPVVDPNNPP